QDAINNILLVCLLGLTAVLLALMIFANTVTSDIEQERNRIGILQSLGVSNRQLIKRQLYIGLVASGLALIIANAVLWIAVAVYAAFSDAVLGNLLWGYPWLVHIALCIALAVIITLLYIMPMHSLRRYLPIENIKTRK
ncbi:MAG: FtsX-like permease family protein, partial [Oscillospiraceae bacterium]|nr:FtsX-like permease family protein [Oscillospiraceae bacterium]